MRKHLWRIIRMKIKIKTKIKKTSDVASSFRKSTIATKID